MFDFNKLFGRKKSSPQSNQVSQKDAIEDDFVLVRDKNILSEQSEIYPFNALKNMEANTVYSNGGYPPVMQANYTSPIDNIPFQLMDSNYSTNRNREVNISNCLATIDKIENYLLNGWEYNFSLERTVLQGS